VDLQEPSVELIGRFSVGQVSSSVCSIMGCQAPIRKCNRPGVLAGTDCRISRSLLARQIQMYRGSQQPCFYSPHYSCGAQRDGRPNL
jgi:hypothetical protein